MGSVKQMKNKSVFQFLESSGLWREDYVNGFVYYRF